MKSEKPKYIQLRLFSRTVGYTIRINGVPVASFQGKSTSSSVAEINQWLVAGKNSVDIYVEWPHGLPYTSGEGRFEFAVFPSFPDVDDPNPDNKYVDYQWPRNGIPETYPNLCGETIDLGDFPHTRLQDAEQVETVKNGVFEEPANGDKAIIISLVRELNMAFLKKDVDKIYELQRIKYEDIAVARYKDKKAQKEIIIEQLNWLKSLGELELSGKNDEEYRFEFLNGNKIVLVTQGGINDPKPAVAVQEKGDGGKENQISVDAYFAKIGGKWTIIR